MAIRINFTRESPAKLAKSGLTLPFIHPTTFHGPFELEPPVVIQGNVFTDGPFQMGAFSANYGGRLRNLRIGRYCSIAPDLQTGWDNHPTDWVSSSMINYVQDLHGWANFAGRPDFKPEHSFKSMPGQTIIGNDVWTGYGVFIAAGVTIGDGAIIGAKSVVTRDVPPYAIAVGSPARVIRYRFPERVVDELMRLQWWKYKLLDMPPGLAKDIRGFIDHVGDAAAKGSIQPYAPKIIRPADIQALLEA